MNKILEVLHRHGVDDPWAQMVSEEGKRMRPFRSPHFRSREEVDRGLASLRHL